MIYITGDLHGSHDIAKLAENNFKEQNGLTRSDYLIICGDFGLRWCDSEDERFWLKWLDKRPWTTLWIDGNHENFDMLKRYTVEDWNGGKIQRITDHILHLCRGSIFDIDGKRIFAFGGAESHDKEYRKPHESVWEEELPSYNEIEGAHKALEQVAGKVDIIITHSLPGRIQNELFSDGQYKLNRLTDFFDEVDEKVDFRLWFSGHYHLSGWYDEKHILVYNDIVKLTDNGIERVYSSL